MTNTQANALFRTKYPTGTIWEVGNENIPAGKIGVTFSDDGRVYKYAATSYQQILARFGFKVLYKHNIEMLESEIQSIQKVIKDDGFFDPFTGFEILTDTKRKELEKRIIEIQKKIDTAIVVI